MSNEEILKVTIHSCDNYFNLKALYPALCMHVIDGKTGTYVKKSDRNRPVVSFYEIQRNDLDYIMPIMTRSSSISVENSKISLKWEETFILNERYDVFVNKDSDVIFFFEILEMTPVSVTKHDYERLNPGGMKKLAWAFLKVHGSNNSINIGSKLRLQLYKASRSQKLKNDFVEVYGWWLKKPRASLETSLLISIEPFHSFSVEPALRSMLPIQQEKGSTVFEKLVGFEKGSPVESADVSEKARTNYEKTFVKWTRKAGEPCKIPTKRTLLLEIISSCQVLKFSRSGRALAVGCGSQGCYYLMIYQIPEGNILHKILAHPEVIYDLDWSLNDCYLLSASGDYNVKMWNTNRWNLVASFVHPSFVYSAKFHPTDFILASACYDHIIRIWNIEKKSLLKELESHLSTVCYLCWNFSGTKLYSADGLGQIKVWTKKRKGIGDTYDLKPEIILPKIPDVSISKILLDLKEEHLFLFCSDSLVRILNINEKTILVLESDVSSPKFPKGCCSPCSNLLFVNNNKGDVSVWEKNTGSTCVKNISYNLNYGNISCIEYHPYENMIALGFQDDSVPIHIYVNDEQTEKDVSDCDGVAQSSSTSLCNSTKGLDMKNNHSNEEILFSEKKDGEKQTYLNRDIAATVGKNKKPFTQNNLPATENSNRGSFDFYQNKVKAATQEKELLTAVITNKGQFDVIALPEDSTVSESITYRSAQKDPIVPNRSSKRSLRRKKLRELDKCIN